MVKRCSFCESRGGFELSDELKAALKIPECLWSSFQYICLEHFEAEDLTVGKDRTRLRTGAFPTIFPRPLSSYFETYLQHDSLEPDSLEPASLASTQKSGNSQCSIFEPSEYEVEDEPDMEEGPGGEEEEVDYGEDDESEGATLFLVSKESLYELLQRCRTPGCALQCEINIHTKGELKPSHYSVKIFFSGAQLKAKTECVAGHKNTWQSSPDVGEKGTTAASINVDFCSSLLLSGLRFTRVKAIFSAKFLLPDSDHYRNSLISSESRSSPTQHFTRFVSLILWICLNCTTAIKEELRRYFFISPKFLSALN